MPIHAPNERATSLAYEVFKRETFEQFTLFRDAGYRFDLWLGLGEPYPNSAAMLDDVRYHGHLWVHRVDQDDLPRDHPLATTSPVSGWLSCELFRGVYGLAGHAWGGFSYSARGEESACEAQLMTSSASAHPAVVAETRMQNAWANFGRHRRTPDGADISQGMVYVPLEYPPQKAYSPTNCAMSHERWRVSTQEAEVLSV